MVPFAKDLCLEGGEARPLPPGGGGKSGLAAQVVQHLFEPPSLLWGNLGEEDRRTAPLLEKDAVPSDDDVARSGDGLHRGEDGYLDLQLRHFREGEAAKARILEGGLECHHPDERGERTVRDHVADAAAQAAPFLESDEDAACNHRGGRKAP